MSNTHNTNWGWDFMGRWLLSLCWQFMLRVAFELFVFCCWCPQNPNVGCPTCHLIPFAYFYQQMHPELLWIYSTIRHLFTFVLWKHLYYSFSLKGKNWFWNSIDYVKLYENDNDFHVSKSNFFFNAII